MLKNKKIFLLDIDGTVSIGNDVIDGTFEFLDYVSSKGGKYIFITNNSSKSIDEYVEKFNDLGFKVDNSNFITSSYATALYLKKNYDKNKIFVLGTKSFIDELKKFDLNVTDKLEDKISCVVVAYDNELTYAKIEIICKILSKNKDIHYIATNPDLVCPVSFGFVPDCGSLCMMIENATKRTPKYIGKPNKFIVDICIDKYNCRKRDMLIIGDRLYTDILCGVNTNIDTCLVLTGEATKNDLKKSKIQPQYVFKSIRELYKSLK